MSLLSIRNLWKQYGNRIVLEHVDLDIAAHDLCVVSGPPGCGKTTLLNILAGHEPATCGTLTLDGTSPQPDERAIVLHRNGVVPHLSVLQNLMLNPASRSFDASVDPRQQRAALMRADELLYAVGLERDRARLAGALTQTMQQRLALARSLFMQPRILLIDEIGETSDAAEHLHPLIADLWATQGDLTVLLVSSDMQAAFRLGSRILVFDRVVSDSAGAGRGATLTYDIRLDHAPRIPAYGVRHRGFDIADDRNAIGR